MKTSPHTIDSDAIQKGADFCTAFMLGFEVQDAVALLRLDDLYIESFQVIDVKLLNVSRGLPVRTERLVLRLRMPRGRGSSMRA